MVDSNTCSDFPFFQMLVRRMTRLAHVKCLIVLVSSARACRISFGRSDGTEPMRNVFERDLFNITGQLEFCLRSFAIRNVSTSNPQLKRPGIGNLSSFAQSDQISRDHNSSFSFLFLSTNQSHERHRKIFFWSTSIRFVSPTRRRAATKMRRR